jgi:hypothetical protein
MSPKLAKGLPENSRFDDERTTGARTHQYLLMQIAKVSVCKNRA